MTKKKPIDRDALERKVALLKELAWAKKYRALDFYEPYEKQKAFHNASANYNQIFFMAANRVGKSFCGAMEVAFHVTGRYPEWWTGRRFTRPVTVWVSTDSAQRLREVVQAKLFGNWQDVSARGSGSIPFECVDWKNDVTMSRFVTEQIDKILVQHETNGHKDGKSSIALKAYTQGREAWQGEAVDIIWMDEEPADASLYSEALTRLIPVRKGEKRGIMIVTATPLLAASSIRDKFINDPDAEQTIVRMTLYDAEHIDKAEIDAAVAATPEHLRNARIMGVPNFGGGMVFSSPERQLRVEDFDVPAHWYLLWGIDFGIRHPFAAVLIAWDKDADVLYVTRCIRMKDALPREHADAMKPFGADVPVAWPQDGTQRKDFGDKLTQTAKIYKAHGLKMQEKHAQFPDGSNETHAGLLEMEERMKSDRFKVFASCQNWFEEYRTYHRDEEGHLVKVRDDLMSATRVAVMAKRGARIRERFAQQMRSGGPKLCRGANPDAWGA